MKEYIENAVEHLRQQPLKRVLFVCLGNICRSPATEGILRRMVDDDPSSAEWQIDSAGIGNWHAGDLPDRRMRVHALRRGYDLTHHARQVKSSDFDNFDLIVGMDAGNIADLRSLAPSPEAEAKIVPMAAFVQNVANRFDHIPDPYYEGAEGFEIVLDLLEDGISNLKRLAEAR